MNNSKAFTFSKFLSKLVIISTKGADSFNRDYSYPSQRSRVNPLHRGMAILLERTLRMTWQGEESHLNSPWMQSVWLWETGELVKDKFGEPIGYECEYGAGFSGPVPKGAVLYRSGFDHELEEF